MSADGSNGVLEKILLTVGRIEGRCDGIETRLDRIDARLDMGSAHMRDQGQETAKHGEQIRELTSTVERQQRSISALYKRVDATEDTGVLHVAEERTRWSTLRWLAVILVGALSVIATVSSLVRCHPVAVTSPDAGQRR